VVRFKKKADVGRRIHDTDACLLACVVSMPGTRNRSRFHKSKVIHSSKKISSERVEIINEDIVSNLYSGHLMTLFLTLVSWG